MPTPASEPVEGSELLFEIGQKRRLAHRLPGRRLDGLGRHPERPVALEPVTQPGGCGGGVAGRKGRVEARHVAAEGGVRPKSATKRSFQAAGRSATARSPATSARSRSKRMRICRL